MSASINFLTFVELLQEETGQQKSYDELCVSFILGYLGLSFERQQICCDLHCNN